MQEPIETYLRREREVLALARATAFRHERDELLKIAMAWRRMAEEAARRTGVKLPKDEQTSGTD